MIRHLQKIVLCTIAGAMVFAFSCKKPDAPDNGNNNNNGNIGGANAPKISVLDPTKDTTVGIDPAPNLTITVTASASDTNKLDSIVGTDGLGYHIKFSGASLPIVGGVAVIYNHYQVLASAVGTTITMTYSAYDNHGNKGVATRKIKVTSVPVFGYWTVILGDQTANGNGAFLNTGANPKPLIYTEGQVNSDTSLRRMVDMACAQTKGQTDMVFSPGYVNSDPGSPSESFSDSDIFSINSTWLPSQRKITLFRKIVLPVTSNNYPDYVHVEAAYKNATETPKSRVEYTFSPNDTYAYLTSDGRYGVFTVVAYGGGVKMTMAIESK